MSSKLYSIEVEYIPGGDYAYLQDFDLGDTVTVEYPGVFTKEAQIIAITESRSVDGFSIRLTLNLPEPDLLGIIRNISNSINPLLVI